MFWGLFILVFLSTFLTFFCGFGLGTLLFAMLLPFYPTEIAISLIAIIHLSQSIFKVLINRKVNWQTFVRFGIPSMVFSFLGALVLKTIISHSVILYEFVWLHGRPVTFVKFIMAILLMFFSYMELSGFRKWRNAPHWVGGSLSGFFGGLSGHQGALRSVFLLDRIQDKAVFISTGAMISVANDVVRLFVYTQFSSWELFPIKDV